MKILLFFYTDLNRLAQILGLMNYTNFLEKRKSIALVETESPESGKLIFLGQKERPTEAPLWTLEK